MGARSGVASGGATTGSFTSFASWTQADPEGKTATWSVTSSNLAKVACPDNVGNSTYNAILLALTGGQTSPPVTLQTSIRYAQRGALLIAGVGFTDGTTHGAGKQIVGGIYDAGIADPTRSIQETLTNFTTRGTIPIDNSRTVGDQSAWFYIRHAWTAANTFQLSWSTNEEEWISETAQTYTMTPTHYGLFVSTYNTSWTPDRVVLFEELVVT